MNPMFEEYEKSGCIKGLVYGEQNENMVKGIYFVPADNRYMDIAGEKSIMPYPSLIFCLYAQKGTITRSLCFALYEKNMESLTLDSKPYAFPFGNVNPSNARICWGSNCLGNMSDLESLRSAITTFFSSE